MGHPAQTSLSERLRSIEAEIAAGQAESALAHCQEIFAQYPRALAVQRVLGEIYLALRKPREALGALDRALAGDPEDARACCARAVIHQMHGDPLAALAWYRRACDTRPDDQTLRGAYREMAARLGRPPYQPTRLGLARLYVRGSLFTHAIREWETLIAENGDLLEAQVGLVETLWRVERTKEAEEWARRVLMNTPSCVKPLVISGIIARDAHRAEDASRLLQRAAELDPDHRIARALFTDRAMADDDLRTLFWGDEPVIPPTQRPSYGPQRQTAAPPTTTSAPASAQMTGAPSLADLSSALSRPDLSVNLSRPLPQPSRPQQLPAQFHSMFKETENMLWGPEISDPGAAPMKAPPISQAPGHSQAPTGAPASAGSVADGAPQFGPAGEAPFERSSQFVPPAIAESQFAMGDTETRRAIRWVQWLQAQGARMRSDDLQRSRPTGSLDALLGAPGQKTGPVVPPYPFGDRMTQAPLTSLPSMPSTGPTEPLAADFAEPGKPSAPSAPLAEAFAPPAMSASQPLTAPRAEDLRQMFAELEPTMTSPAPAMPTNDVGEVATERLPELTAMPPENSGAWPEALAAAFEWPSQPGATAAPQPTVAPGDGPDVTLEALEGVHSAHGYQQITLGPGALAAFADSAQPAQQPGETARALDAFFQEPEQPPLPPVPPLEPEQPAQPAIAPDDYPARLAHARDLRDGGSLDEALVEYRALLRNAPDLLPDVLNDLEASLDEQPEHPELHRLLGDARIRQGDYTAALESLNRSVSLTQPTDE